MTALTVTTDRMKFLRLALAADAVVTGGNGLIYLAFAGPVGTLLGPDAGLLRGIGVFLLVYGIAVGLLATRREISPAGTKAVIALNIIWTLASIAAVVTGAAGFTTIGAIWAIAQALVVALFAELQITGLRKTRTA
ncbi:hypothetical protein [Nonomuraea gerenzanensis]|uniref:Integral membrane protein n=1 Tax=Nonomuraea gerenzanensis TaxID=93944 RepID=A0A1M4EID1_9ACTN|nr:hypothetical protein [Nonomuraea gerenzanensis]UBU09872.1 hypothetical protein LCN96_36710 [Nonomuraea gerenzanensis]SBO98323.1 hypothetical protein BN4615_P7839 [Nonomuraea gerenzanensis]